MCVCLECATLASGARGIEAAVQDLVSMKISTDGAMHYVTTLNTHT